MKRKLLFLLALCSAMAGANAQSPTLTADNTSPRPGDSYVSQYAKTANLTDFSGGASQVWDYSNLVDSNLAVTLQAVTPSSTPFADSFPGSNLAVKTLEDSVYIYFNSSSSALYQLGVATQDSATLFRYQKPRIYLSYPFTYGSFFTDTVTQQIEGLPYTFNGKDSISGDGYGTLILPGKTYDNVLRVRYIEHLSFASDSLGISTTVSIRIVNYLYYTPGIHAPLFSSVSTQTKTVVTFSGFPIVNETVSTKNFSYLKEFVLPLSFQSFRASLQNKEIALQWKTAQETNTDHFTVQRSLNGCDFQKIADVKATGNAAGSLYNYTDGGFAKGNVPPVVYYRIQETDKDGRQFLSAVAVVHGSTVIVSIYPNPATDYVRLAAKEATIADAIVLYDAKGRLVQQWHNYPLSQPISLVNRSAGAYFMQITINGKTTGTAIIKQ